MPVPVYNDTGVLDGQAVLPRMTFAPNGAVGEVEEWLGRQGGASNFGRTEPTDGAALPDGETEELVIYGTRFRGLPQSDARISAGVRGTTTADGVDRRRLTESPTEYLDRQAAITLRHEMEGHATTHSATHPGGGAARWNVAERAADRAYRQHQAAGTLAEVDVDGPVPQAEGAAGP